MTPQGRLRYLDAEWKLKDGRRVVLEVDGAHHLEVTSWQSDMRRERSLVVGGAQVLRATAIELRVEPTLVVADLRAIGVPRVVSVSGRQSNHRC
jgi:very-short-patch-repair endonuclease